MATVTKIAGASYDANSAKRALYIAGLIAGEDLDPLSACYISDSDGKVYMATASDGFAGVAPVKTLAGRPVTLFGHGARASYSDGALTPGQALGQSAATAGALDDATTPAVAMAVTKNDIVITALVVVESEGS